MSIAKTKNQHLLSQFHLRYFSSDISHCNIWCYDTHLQKTETKSIAQIAFYPKAKGWSQEVEDRMNKIETGAKNAIDALIKNTQLFRERSQLSGTLDLDNYKFLIEFIGLQLKRSMTQTNHLQDSLKEYTKKEEENITEKQLRTYILDKQMEDCFSKTEIEGLLKKTLHIHILDNRNDKSFIVSDTPFFITKDADGNSGTTYPKSELWFSLTPQICVSFGGEKDSKFPDDAILWHSYKADPKGIRTTNKRFCISAGRYIFSKNKKLVEYYGKWHKSIGDSLLKK